jgi:hypothetical protein
MTSDGKNKHAVALGKRAAELRTPAEREQIARHAATVRWQRHRQLTKTEFGTFLEPFTYE